MNTGILITDYTKEFPEDAATMTKCSKPNSVCAMHFGHQQFIVQRDSKTENMFLFAM
jgi:hypothetical protein